MNDLIKSAEGSIKKAKRLGRGDSSGSGGESGRGHKGQKSRTGYSRKAGFEGGQTPLYRRLPKKRGLGNSVVSPKPAVINLNTIELNFNDGEIVNLNSLKEKGLVKKSFNALKVLGKGDLTKKVTIQAKQVSGAVQEKLQQNTGITLHIL
jgi:large subunit ribosomal protein L15